MLLNRILTDKQIEAARANGKKSRGPVTPQGKYNAAHSRSPLGPLAKTIVLDGESAEKFRHLLDSLHAELLPESPVEIHLVESMAAARWRQIRLWALEKATIANELAKTDPAAPLGDDNDPAIDRTVTACEALVNGSHWTEHMSRTESRHDRLYNRAMKLFHKHRDWRREQLKNDATNPVTE